MVLKRSFTGDTGEDSAWTLFMSPGRQSIKSVTLEKPLHIHYSGLSGDTAWSYYNSFIWKIVLNCHLLVALEKTLLCMFIAQVSWEAELQVGDNGEACVHLLFRSVRVQNFNSVEKMVLIRLFLGDTVETLFHMLIFLCYLRDRVS